MRTDIVDVIRGGADDQNSEPAMFCWCGMFLSIVMSASNSFSARERSSPFLLATEACVSHRLALVAFGSEQEFYFPGYTLVEQQLHFRAEDKLALASSIAAIACARLTLGKSSRNSLRFFPCSR